jgi:hypothetical protein
VVVGIFCKKLELEDNGMASANEKLAASLDELHKHQKDGILKSGDISRTHRERLAKLGYLVGIIKGWNMAVDAAVNDGSSTAWFSSYWPFVKQYLGARFGSNYYLSAETSLAVHVGETTIPAQIIVVAKTKTIQAITLPHGRSIFIRPPAPGESQSWTLVDGLRVMSLPAAICKATPSMFEHYPNIAEFALRMITDASELLHVLLDGGNTVVAGRLAGAYRFLQMEDFAVRIENAMSSAGHAVRLINPFTREAPALSSGSRPVSPYSMRIEAMWNSMRKDVISIFPPQPGMVIDAQLYLKEIDGIYVHDAYNSLSIEGYMVTRELIEKVRSGNWDPVENKDDKDHKSALAAKGYSLAYKKVKESIRKIIQGGDAAKITYADHQDWYREMFSPSVQAGILLPHLLAGYRNDQVFIRDSQHTPLPKHALLDSMEMLLTMWAAEPEASVRAVLGHFIFVFIHPYMDGNGRIGRFIMNAMFASGGYPWTVVRYERRTIYFTALEQASVNGNIRPFAEFILQELLNKSTVIP